MSGGSLCGRSGASLGGGRGQPWPVRVKGDAMVGRLRKPADRGPAKNV